MKPSEKYDAPFETRGSPSFNGIRRQGQTIFGPKLQYLIKLLDYDQTQAAQEYAHSEFPNLRRGGASINGRPSVSSLFFNSKDFSQIFTDRGMPITGHAYAQIAVGRPDDLATMKMMWSGMIMTPYEELAARALKETGQEQAIAYLRSRVEAALVSSKSSNPKTGSTLAPELIFDDQLRIPNPVCTSLAVQTMRLAKPSTTTASAESLSELGEKLETALQEQPTSTPLLALAIAVELTSQPLPSPAKLDSFVNALPKLDDFPANMRGAAPATVAQACTEAIQILKMVEDPSSPSMSAARDYLEKAGKRFGNQRLLALQWK